MSSRNLDLVGHKEKERESNIIVVFFSEIKKRKKGFHGWDVIFYCLGFCSSAKNKVVLSSSSALSVLCGKKMVRESKNRVIRVVVDRSVG